MKRVTPWFPVSKKPVRVGWYEVMWDEKYPGADGRGYIERQYWLGEAFYYAGGDRHQIVFTKTGIGELPGDKWRGLKARK